MANTQEPRIIRTVCKEGICPLCGGAVRYTYKGSMIEYGVYRWKCPHCGAWGQEGNKTVFDGKHYHVHDKDGTPCTLVFFHEEAALEDLLPLLNQDQKEKTISFVNNLIAKEG